jgi:hypothetical protein
MEERGEASINGGRREETRNGKEAGTPLVTYASGWLAGRARGGGRRRRRKRTERGSRLSRWRRRMTGGSGLLLFGMFWFDGCDLGSIFPACFVVSNSSWVNVYTVYILHSSRCRDMEQRKIEIDMLLKCLLFIILQSYITPLVSSSFIAYILLLYGLSS